MGRHGLDSSGSRQGQLAGIVNEVMNLRVSLNAGNFLTSWGPVSFSERALLHGVTQIWTVLTFWDAKSVFWGSNWIFKITQINFVLQRSNKFVYLLWIINIKTLVDYTVSTFCVAASLFCYFFSLIKVHLKLTFHWIWTVDGKLLKFPGRTDKSMNIFLKFPKKHFKISTFKYRCTEKF